MAFSETLTLDLIAYDHERRSLKTAAVDAKWGLSCIFVERRLQMSICGIDENDIKRRDLEYQEERMRTMKGDGGYPPFVLVNPSVALSAEVRDLFDDIASELRLVARWQAFFYNSPAIHTRGPGGLDLSNPFIELEDPFSDCPGHYREKPPPGIVFDSAGLIRELWALLRKHPGKGQPKMPRGEFDVTAALNAVDDVILWCKEQHIASDGMAGMRDGEPTGSLPVVGVTNSIVPAIGGPLDARPVELLGQWTQEEKRRWIHFLRSRAASFDQQCYWFPVAFDTFDAIRGLSNNLAAADHSPDVRVVNAVARLREIGEKLQKAFNGNNPIVTNVDIPIRECMLRTLKIAKDWPDWFAENGATTGDPEQAIGILYSILDALRPIAETLWPLIVESHLGWQRKTTTDLLALDDTLATKDSKSQALPQAVYNPFKIGVPLGPPTLGKSVERGVKASVLLDAHQDDLANLAHTASEAQTTPPPKKSTKKGEGRSKLTGVLTNWHGYHDSGCDNTDPISVQEARRQASVSSSTASDFFTWWLGGHDQYKVICRNGSSLAFQLQRLRGELSPAKEHSMYEDAMRAAVANATEIADE